MKTANEDRSSSAGQGRILAGGRKNGLIFWRERSLPPAFFIVFQKKRPPIENQNNQNSIRTGSFLLSVCCSFFVVSTFPSVACFRCRQPSLYRRERGKVFGLNTLCLTRKTLPETERPPDLLTSWTARKQAAAKWLLAVRAGMCATLASLFHQSVHFP